MLSLVVLYCCNYLYCIYFYCLDVSISIVYVAAHETFLGELNLTDWFFSVDNGASYQGDLVEVIKTDVTTVNVIFQSG